MLYKNHRNPSQIPQKKEERREQLEVFCESILETFRHEKLIQYSNIVQKNYITPILHWVDIMNYEEDTPFIIFLLDLNIEFQELITPLIYQLIKLPTFSKNAIIIYEEEKYTLLDLLSYIYTSNTEEIREYIEDNGGKNIFQPENEFDEIEEFERSI